MVHTCGNFSGSGQGDDIPGEALRWQGWGGQWFLVNPLGPAGPGPASPHICHLAGPLSLGSVVVGVAETML